MILLPFLSAHLFVATFELVDAEGTSRSDNCAAAFLPNIKQIQENKSTIITNNKSVVLKHLVPQPGWALATSSPWFS
jgi:hypothetical protein